jgi:hypothetical protein
MTDPRGVCASSADDLTTDVPYVRVWFEGLQGAQALVEQLRLAGLGDGFPALKADVNVVGDGVVRVDSVRPDVARRLVGLLGAGLIAEMLDNWAQEDVAGHSGTATGVPDSEPQS